jgi:hypothetical protein
MKVGRRVRVSGIGTSKHRLGKWSNTRQNCNDYIAGFEAQGPADYGVRRAVPVDDGDKWESGVTRMVSLGSF